MIVHEAHPRPMLQGNGLGDTTTTAIAVMLGIGAFVTTLGYVIKRRNRR